MAKPDCLALPAHPAETRAAAFELYRQGKPYVDIAYELHVPAPTLRAWSRREQWRERAEVMKAAPEVDFEAAITIVAAQEREEDIPLELSEQREAYQTDMRKAALLMSKHVAAMEPSEILAKSNKIKDSDFVARKALGLEEKPANRVIQIGILAGQGIAR